jgi:hypothetical protein
MELEEIKFHWEKWKGESKAFFGRALLATFVLLLSILYQWNIIEVKSESIKILSSRPLFVWFIHILSWLLLWFFVFRLVDLLRHRVPKEMEKHVHREQLDIPSPAGLIRIDLRKWAQFLWMVFVAYILLFFAALIVTFLHLLAIQTGWRFLGFVT